MNRPLIPLSLAAVLACQTMASAAAPAAPAAAKAQSTAQIQLQSREARAAQKLEQLKQADARVEEGIGKVVETLKSVADSNDSKTRVIQLKREVIEGLGKCIGYYRQKRRDLREQLGKAGPTSKAEDLQKGIAALDERVEKRVAQILELAGTLGAKEDVEKFKVYATDERRRIRDDEFIMINEDWTQNQRIVRMGFAEQKQLAAALDKSIADLERQAIDLQSRLDAAKDEANKVLLEADLEHVRTALVARQANQKSLSAGAANSGREVGRKEADTMEDLIRDMVRDLKTDFFLVFRLYGELLQERVAIAQLKAAGK